jgi:hypothetical protein
VFLDIEPKILIAFYKKEKITELLLSSDIVDWLNGCKYGIIPYLQNNWTLHFSTIVTF